MRAHYGLAGLASREEIRRWYEAFGESMNDDLAWAAEHEAPKEEGRG